MENTCIKLKTKTVPQSNRKVIKTEAKFDTLTNMHDRSLYWFGTWTPIKSYGVKLEFYEHTQLHLVNI
jgi:hypothetical protein